MGSLKLGVFPLVGNKVLWRGVFERIGLINDNIFVLNPMFPLQTHARSYPPNYPDIDATVQWVSGIPLRSETEKEASYDDSSWQGFRDRGA